MNKKQLVVAAIATMLSVSTANASNISGITGVDGVFNIDPALISGDVGYRYYENFNLSEGDIANLIYQGYKNGQLRNIEAFLNLVSNKINIQGILNTMRNGNFHDGHAIFISPNGMVVGASGVLNVGQLSVITPTNEKFSSLKDAYNNRDYASMNEVSKLRSSSAVNYGGNADVTIDGTVLARNGVDVRGADVNIAGNIINGIKNTEVITSADRAKAIFNALVNTDGIATSNALNNGSMVIVKSGAGANSGITITGKVANLNNNGETAITNHGSNGLKISGLVLGSENVNIYNNSKTGNLNVDGTLVSGKNLAVTNKGADLNITKSARVSAAEALEIVNNGSGTINLAGKTSSNSKTDIVNRGAGINATGSIVAKDAIRIVNENGKLALSNSIISEEKSVSIRNKGVQGMEVGGKITAVEGILVQNEAGNATLNGELASHDNIVVYNEGNGKLMTTANSKIATTGGSLAVKNAGQGGMNLNGVISNEAGEIAINNLAGYATVNGEISSNGNVGVINKDNGTGMTINGKVSSINGTDGIKIVNSSGASGLTINGNVTAGNGNLYVYNDKGIMNVNGTVRNYENGNVYLLSRKDSTGIRTSADSKIIQEDKGTIVIKNNGKVALNNVGMDLNGTIKNNQGGETAINNYTGVMHVGGTIDSFDAGNLGIINRAGADEMVVDANIIEGSGSTINIKNYGTDMHVNGNITHSGRLNILANEGNLYLNGKITNEGTDMTYAAARANGDGITVGSNFEANATEGGTILIKNITGQNGLTYEGNMNSENGQVEVYNKVGDMKVTGDMAGKTTVILNTGNNLTVTETSELQGQDVKVVNKGKNTADIADKHRKYYYEQLQK